MKRHMLYLASLLLAVVYFVGGKLGLQLAFVHSSATAVWPPSGITLAAFLILGYRVWPGIFIGAFLVNITTAGTFGTSLGIALGNTLEGLLGAYLVQRFAGGSKAFQHTRDIVRFVILAGLVAPIVSATFGVTSLTLSGSAGWADYGAIWITWWLGDVVSELIIAPCLLLWSEPADLAWSRRRLPELLVLLLSVLLVAGSVFGALLPLGTYKYPLEFFCIPPLIWAAFRFGRRETATVALILSVIAIAGTLQGYGPFVRDSPNESLLLLQAFAGTIMVLGLTVAALVDERRQAEQALQLQKALLEAQREASIDGILVVSSAGRILSFNQRFVDLWGVRPEVMATRSDRAALKEIAPQLDDPEGFLAQVAELYTQPHAVSQAEISLRDGRVFERYSAPILDEHSQNLGRIWFFRDITERTRAEEATRQAILLRDQFLSLAAHELKTPMTTILGSAQLLQRYLHKDEHTTDRERRRSKIMVDQVQRLYRLINSLLDVSRIHDGRLVLESEPLDFSAVVAQIVEELHPTLEQHQLELNQQAGPCMVQGDRLRLEQVIQNVLHNAIKYSPEGGTIQIGLGRENGRIYCTIADRGIGIPAAERDRIFDRFYRADNVNPNQLSGMGIGLYVVREIVALHMGTVEVESVEGAGSTFTISLPAHNV